MHIDAKSEAVKCIIDSYQQHLMITDYNRNTFLQVTEYICNGIKWDIHFESLPAEM